MSSENIDGGMRRENPVNEEKKKESEGEVKEREKKNKEERGDEESGDEESGDKESENKERRDQGSEDSKDKESEDIKDKESEESKDKESEDIKDKESEESKDKESEDSKDNESEDSKDNESEDSKDNESKESKDNESKESKDKTLVPKLPLEDNYVLPQGLSDLAVRILTEIHKGTYTCMICTGDIDSESRVWSCPMCSRVFDLECIRDWATRGSSTAEDRSWRCPACNERIHRLPKRYTCWCGKVVDPVENGPMPHSCGQTCGAALARCVHGCPLECHPGPHAERCTAMGPVMRCHCGRETRQVPCSLTPYGRGWSCGAVCGDLMPCGVHRCPRTCHAGLCGPCRVPVVVSCYCGRETRTVACCDVVAAYGGVREDAAGAATGTNDTNVGGTSKPKSISNPGTSADTARILIPHHCPTSTTPPIAGFSCNQTCNALLSCKVHRCTRECHPWEGPGGHECPRSPRAVTRCPCGKKTLEELGSRPRTRCTDPVATCGGVCGRLLACGMHRCYWRCHEGPCAPCYGEVDLACRCGREEYAVACRLAQTGYRPVCHHRCMARLSCRRHVCGARCCPFEQAALRRERQRARDIRHGALSPASPVDIGAIEPAHVCTRECGRTLSCGLHTCHARCHAGPCPVCLESSSVDLVCACGRTVVPAPVRCGTKLPVCPYPCTRHLPCGHRAPPHHCHPDNVACPPCTVLVTRPCPCHRHIPVPRVLCSQKTVSCGRPCGLLLPCGVHHCRRVCHPPGHCESTGATCSQQCGRTLPCGHACHRKCHGGSPCDPDRFPCRVPVLSHCPCGRRSANLPCHAVSSGKSLPCDDECVREKRNKLMYAALGLGEPTSASSSSSPSSPSPLLLSKHSLATSTYSDFVLQLYAKQPVWCSSIQKILTDLISRLSTSKGPSSYHFRPMKTLQRRFIHELAQSYGVFSESQDPEPKRSVFLNATASSHRPRISLSDALAVSRRVDAIEHHRAALRQKTYTLQAAASSDASIDAPAPANAIAISDVFFGVSRDRIHAALCDLWSGPRSDAVAALGDPQIKWIKDGLFAFYGSNYRERSPMAQVELQSLCDEFRGRLTKSNLAMSCCLASIDDEASVVYGERRQKKAPAKAGASIDASNFDWY
ncbi:hypothetical protein HII13_002057 [Brettanomyces bruxellensis]|nr:hypothetical protein HII13_002057 [Brettanomyces bruxellensis]